jgi:hypothetical protein
MPAQRSPCAFANPSIGRQISVALAVWACSLSSVHAGEVYVGLGLPGVMLGYAQPLDSGVTLRGDFATLGSRSADGDEEGIRYTGTAKVQRIGLFADWFVAGGGFRLTGGLTSNDAGLKLTAGGNGAPINIGGTTYPTTPADRLDVVVKYPSTMPYVGIGYGHQSGSSGLGFVFDLGVAVGKPKVSATTQGPSLSQVSQADLDRELQELRDGVGSIKVLPQVSLGVSYRF